MGTQHFKVKQKCSYQLVAVFFSVVLEDLEKHHGFSDVLHGYIYIYICIYVYIYMCIYIYIYMHSWTPSKFLIKLNVNENTEKTYKSPGRF